MKTRGLPLNTLPGVTTPTGAVGRIDSPCLTFESPRWFSTLDMDLIHGRRMRDALTFRHRLRCELGRDMRTEAFGG